MKPIPGFEGYYCDELGRVWSTKSGEARQMKTRRGRAGYEVVALSMGAKGRYHYGLVHRLVLLAHKGDAPGMQANHKNGIRHDNRLENLEWLTRTENERHARRELGKKLHGAYHPCSKLTDADIPVIRRRKAAGEPYSAIAKDYGMGISQLHRIIKGEKWRHV